MALSLENSEGFSRPGWIAAFRVTGGVSFYLLAVALRELPVGTAYAVLWTGIGAVGTAALGILLLGECQPVASRRDDADCGRDRKASSLPPVRGGGHSPSLRVPHHPDGVLRGSGLFACLALGVSLLVQTIYGLLNRSYPAFNTMLRGRRYPVPRRL